MSDEKAKPWLWKPGVSGNPSGRPKGREKWWRDITAPYDEAMAKVMIDIVLGNPVPQRMSDGTLVEHHIKPQHRTEAYKIIQDRVWGKAKQTIDLTTDIQKSGLPDDVDSLETVALENLRNTIRAELDPRTRRVIDVTKASRPIPRPPEMKNANPIEVPTQEPITEPVIVQEVVVEVKPEPIKNTVKHVFQGSTNVARAELDLDTGEVEVVFSNGMRYRFGGFSRERLDEWKIALSAGRWFNEEIKGNPKRHPPRKIR